MGSQIRRRSLIGHVSGRWGEGAKGDCGLSRAVVGSSVRVGHECPVSGKSFVLLTRRESSAKVLDQAGTFALRGLAGHRRCDSLVAS